MYAFQSHTSWFPLFWHHHVFIDTEGFATSSSASHLQYTVILPWKIIQIAAHRCTFWSQKIWIMDLPTILGFHLEKQWDPIFCCSVRSWPALIPPQRSSWPPWLPSTSQTSKLACLINSAALNSSAKLVQNTILLADVDQLPVLFNI